MIIPLLINDVRCQIGMANPAIVPAAQSEASRVKAFDIPKPGVAAGLPETPGIAKATPCQE